MNLGEFRKATEHLPDNTDVLGDQGDLEMWELHLGRILPPVLDLPYAITVELGQIVNYELNIDDRIDALHATHSGPKWNKTL